MALVRSVGEDVQDHVKSTAHVHLRRGDVSARFPNFNANEPTNYTEAISNKDTNHRESGPEGQVSVSMSAETAVKDHLG